MPNFCDNILKISGDSEKDIKEFIDFAKGVWDGPGEGDLSLSKFVPMPIELVNVDPFQKFTDKKMKELIEKYGSTDWYRWRIKNWGTKWEVMEHHISKETSNSVKYIFETANYPPIPAVKAMSKKFPSLSFVLIFREDGRLLKGKYVVKNGQVDANQTEGIDRVQNFYRGEMSYYHLERSRAYFSDGERKRFRGNLREAIEAYEHAVIEKPDFVVALYRMASCYIDLNEYQKSIEISLKGLEIDPENAELLYLLGYSYGVLDNFEKAIESFNKAVKIDPLFKQAWDLLGTAYKKIKNHEKAIESFDAYIEIDPKNPRVWSSLGYSNMVLKKFERAIECFDKVIEMGQNEFEKMRYKGIQNSKDEYHGNAYYNKACIESLKNNKAKSIEFLEKAISFDPNKYRNLAREDSDFEKIKNTDGFKKLISIK